MENRNNSAFFGEEADEALGQMLDLTYNFGLLGQREIAICFSELITACVEVERDTRADSYVVPVMDCNNN